MLTAITMTEEKPTRIREIISSLFRPYRITVRARSAPGASLREIRYTRLRGKVDLKALEKEALPQRAVLCTNEIDLDGSKLRRLRSTALSVRWCESFVEEVMGLLSAEKISPRIAFYDPDAEQPSFARKLLSFVTSVTVVTDMPRFYENEAARAAEETGAVMIVSNDTDALFPCDMLIAPGRITSPLPCVPLTPVFTTERPYVSLPGTIIDGYRAPLPERYRELCPEGIDEYELMSALYAFSGAAELGAEKPDRCLCSGKSYTAQDIVRIIKQKV